MAIDPGRTEPRSRRAILAGAIGGVAGLIGSRFVSPDRTSAAAGGPIVMAAANDAGTTNTSLTTASTGTAMLVTQNGTGTALRGSAVGAGSIAGFFTANNGTGISGVTGAGGSYGVFAQNNGAPGSAGALRASGGNNHGIVATSAYGNAYAVKAVNSTAGTGIVGQSLGTTASFGVGIEGSTEGEYGSGVVGRANSHTGNTGAPANGVLGSTLTPGGNGVLGQTSSPTGNGVHGEVTAGTSGGGAAVRADGNQNHGVFATTANESAFAVYATHSVANGTALIGEATATTGNTRGVEGAIAGFGIAVYGVTDFGSAGAAGVYGNAHGEGGRGVIGFASSTTSNTIGVVGEVASPTGTGVYGAIDASTGINYGVYGQSSSATGFGVYSAGHAAVAGNLGVSGAISAGTKDFRIDHPLDPANKFMSHSCVESDDRRTVYDGEVTLDGKGEATVTLPAWFETLNKSFRYQLTAIGAAAPDLHVKTKVAGNQFAVAGGTAGQTVCWQVTGIRQDAYAKAHPLTVEAAKTGTEKGRYIHPEVYGKPASKSIGALHTHAGPTADPVRGHVPA